MGRMRMTSEAIEALSSCWILMDIFRSIYGLAVPKTHLTLVFWFVLNLNYREHAGPQADEHMGRKSYAKYISYKVDTVTEQVLLGVHHSGTSRESVSLGPKVLAIACLAISFT
jgi:hypothetical protein